jgi:hypothetical protein
VPLVVFFMVMIAPIMVSPVCESVTFPVILMPGAEPGTPVADGMGKLEACEKPDKRKNAEMIRM